MLESPRGLRLIVLAAIVLCIVASLTGAHAKAGDDRGGLRIAIIDLQKVQDEYKLVKAFKDITTKQGNDLQTESEVLQRNALLAEADQKTLVELAVKEKSTPAGLAKADADKKKTLETQSTALRDDYIRLQQTPAVALKEGEDKKLKEYIRLELETGTRFKAHQTQLNRDSDTKLKELEQNYHDKLEKALTDVSKKNNFNLILNNQVAPHADAECTKDVVDLMNK